MNLAPLVKGYYDGGDLYFIHTEASDSAVANLLTEMMGPRVVYLPKLAQTPDSLLADVYVFKNVIEGHGPFGFQPDIFGSVPGDPGYSPLRSIHLVWWNEEANTKLQNSYCEPIGCNRNKRNAKATEAPGVPRKD